MSNLQIDGGATRLTNVVVGNQRRTEGFLKFLESEQAAEDGKNATAMRPIQDTLRAIVAEERAFWGKPLAELKQLGQANFEALTPDLNFPTMAEEIARDLRRDAA